MTAPFVHPSAVVDDGVEIGYGTRVWHFCHLLSGTRIGAGCVLGQNCMAGPRVTIGDRVKVQNNVSLYEGVTVEDEVFIGPSAVFTNVINPRAFIERKTEYRPTRLCRGCSIGANAVIVCGVTIGRYALVGAGAVVTRDVPDFGLAHGSPARLRGFVGRSGDRLAFDRDGLAVDPADGGRYRLRDGRVEEEHA